VTRAERPRGAWERLVLQSLAESTDSLA
jgi:hypothetical protein